MATSGERPSLYRYLVFGLLALAYLLVYFHRTGTGVVSVEMEKDLAVDAATLGLLSGAYFWPYALMQLPSGLLTDSWGPRRTITSSFILAALGSVLFGLAQSFTWALFARVLVGIGLAMLFVPTLKVLTRWFTVAEFARMTALLMAVGGLGVLCAAGPLAYLSQAIGWRYSFMIMGIATLAVALAVWVVVRNTPEEKGLPPLPDPDRPQTPPHRMGLMEGMAMVLSRFRFWPLALWYFFTCGIFFSFATPWGGHFFRHVHRLSGTEAGNVLNMLALAMIVGSPLLSHLSTQVLKSRKKLIIITSLVLVALTAWLAFFPEAFNKPLLYVWAFLMSLCASAIVVVGFTCAKELFPVDIAGTAVGLVNLFPFLGGAIFQWVVGLALQSAGGGSYDQAAFSAGFKLYFASSVIALAFAFLQKDTLGPRAVDPYS